MKKYYITTNVKGECNSANFRSEKDLRDAMSNTPGVMWRPKPEYIFGGYWYNADGYCWMPDIEYHC